MATYKEPIDKEAKLKQNLAEIVYELTFHKKAKTDEEVEFLDEIKTQIEVCEGMLRPVEIEKIIEWIRNNNIGRIRTEARKIKFAS